MYGRWAIAHDHRVDKYACLDKPCSMHIKPTRQHSKSQMGDKLSLYYLTFRNAIKVCWRYVLSKVDLTKRDGKHLLVKEVRVKISFKWQINIINTFTTRKPILHLIGTTLLRGLCMVEIKKKKKYGGIFTPNLSLSSWFVLLSSLFSWSSFVFSNFRSSNFFWRSVNLNKHIVLVVED